jgi:hypothetical protein
MVPRVAGHFLFPGPNSQTCLSYWSREIKNNSRRLVPRLSEAPPFGISEANPIE